MFPPGKFDYVIHLATASAAKVGAGGTALALNTLLGTQRVLQFARSCRAKRLLFASSGAVYGHQPKELSHIPETYAGAPNPQVQENAYGEIKRMSELLCTLTPDVDCVIARGFSFVGPYLPLTDKFALGSFIRQALNGGPIRIHGDGSPVRSYLYAADLVIWLLTLLLRGQPNRPYNVGSDQAIDLAALAHEIGSMGKKEVTVEIAKARSLENAEYYVPLIERARSELGLDIKVPLATALQRTIEWARSAALANPEFKLQSAK
jgi:dTDP-glucose 4,6-dehydratase